MGGSHSCFFFGSGKNWDDEVAYETPRYPSSKVRPSDEDRLWYVGERDVDRKASEYIAKFHESRFTDPAA